VTGWTVILPVKPWALAKSRLELPQDERTQMARAFSLDVLDVVTSAPAVAQVIVVTADAELEAIARRVGATVLIDRPMRDRGMLNRAVDEGRRWALVVSPNAPTVVVPGDLAALTGPAFDDALRRLGTADRSFVPDSSGTGTTLLSADRPDRLISAYGRQSAQRHSAAGFRPTADVDDRCRRDVDTAIDLEEARRLGAGPHTAAALSVVKLHGPGAAGGRAGRTYSSVVR
jgi:2-phospho-L-lactate guanylyltransferase